MNKNSLELFSLLSENSHVTDEQMQNAYKSFVEQITTISQSQQSYPEVFRMLNRTRIELDSLESSSLYELEKNKLRISALGIIFFLIIFIIHLIVIPIFCCIHP
jgi:hypothetical protein